MPPKGRDLRFDCLARADAALIMLQADSEPRGKLAWRTPVFRQVKLSHLRHIDLAPSVAVSEPPRMSAWRTL